MKSASSVKARSQLGLGDVVGHRDVRVVREAQRLARSAGADRRLEALARRDALGHLDEDDLGDRSEGAGATQDHPEGRHRLRHRAEVRDEVGPLDLVDLGRPEQVMCAGTYGANGSP